jgi:MFS transporter, ACS family, hexuronate transporter
MRTTWRSRCLCPRASRLIEPYLAAAALLGGLAPWAVMHFEQASAPMLLLVFAGSLAGGCFPLFLAVIPSESVRASQIATSVGIVQAACEIAGGVVAPALLG